MKILFAAPVTFDRITFFISQYTIGLAKAARALGHEVRVVQTTESVDHPTGINLLKQEFHTLQKYCKWLTDYPHDILLMNQIYYEVQDFKPDILFIHLIDTSHAHLIMERIKKRGTRVLTWLGVHPTEVSDGILKLLKSCDFTLIYDPSYIDYYEKNLGIRNLRIVHLGCDVEYYDSIRPDTEFKEQNKSDICFIGQFDSHREKYLKALSDFNLGIWSWNMAEHETDLYKFYRSVVYGDSLIEVIKSSKIALNIHREFEVGGGNYRLFEIPSCGVFQLVDEKKNIGEYFEIGKEIITYKDEYELRDKTQYYLENSEEREEIAKAGHKRVRKDHTLENRIQEIIKIAQS